MGALNKLYNTLNLFHEPMHRLTCDIEINTADGLIRRDHAQSVTIAKHSEQLCDVATVALPRTTPKTKSTSPTLIPTP